MTDGAMPMNPLAQHTPPSVTTSAEPERRPVCPACLRPRSVCICQWVRPVAHTTQVLILQHPQEVGHAKNSARLLHLSLQHSTLLVGEVSDDPDLPTQPRLHTLLLYPSSDTAQPALGMQAASASLASSTPQPATPQPDPARQAPLRLVVLDGTWRQSRAMLRLNPWLQRLTRLSLDDVPPSRYAIRKAHKPGQLSTLEATCAALAQLEGDGERFAPLLQAFDGFVASQMVFRPPSVAVRTPTCVP